MNLNTPTAIKVALTGDVALELAASYFRDAGYEVMPQDADMAAFHPDFVYDLTSHDAILAEEVSGFFDERMRRLAGSPYSAEGLRAIVDEFGWRTASFPAKILAVDADNTLWRGILTEDGPDSLRPCAVFQEGLKRLAHEGVVLVLLSKNNDEELDAYWRAKGTFDFASRKVNWAPKAGNLIEACRELGLGTDAVVFLDDNPHERAQMKAHLPEVTVAPWTGWSVDASREVPEVAQRQLVRRLREYFFFGLGLTEEDRLRADDYHARAARQAAAKSFASREDYLADLGLWVKPFLATEENLDRLAQMAAKTNQFNATTIRRTRGEFAELLKSPVHRVFAFRAGDRFGEQGLVCYVVVDLTTKRITDFVMSCRAMGRGLEYFALTHVSKELGMTPEIDFVPTAKNKPFADFRASLSNLALQRWESIYRTTLR